MISLSQPRVEVDKNGNGACVYAIAHDIGRGHSNGKYLHELLWLVLVSANIISVHIVMFFSMVLRVKMA